MYDYFQFLLCKLMASLELRKCQFTRHLGAKGLANEEATLMPWIASVLFRHNCCDKNNLLVVCTD